MKKYIYNEKTGKLHICDACPHSKTRPYNVRFFDTEDEAIKYAGSKLSWCQLCQKKKEEVIGEVMQ